MAGAPPLIVVAGATATGKTELGIRLAEAIAADGRPATVISADSRQVYRGLDIGTAKVSAADRARVPHAGLDLVDPDRRFALSDYVAHARGVLHEIARDDGVALLVGGTGLYLRAVARGLDLDALPDDPAIRARLEAEFAAEGLEPLAARLQAIAPILASEVHLANPRRVIRALEIAEIRGDGWRPRPRGYDGPVGWVGLDLARDLKGTSNVPICMLTARAEPEERIEGLEIGVDDYVAKPFEPRELLLRLQNILKRRQGPSGPREEVTMGDFTFHVGRGELKRGEDSIKLTERERDLLRQFAQRPGAPIARHELAADDSNGTERAVDVQINRLRRKIESDPAHPVYLQTVRGKGYILYVD